MVYVAHLALEAGIMNAALVTDHVNVLKNLGLPISYDRAQWPELLAVMKLDKKSRGSTLRFVVISEIGQTQRLENPNEGALIAAYEKVSQ